MLGEKKIPSNLLTEKKHSPPPLQVKWMVPKLKVLQTQQMNTVPLYVKYKYIRND